MTRPLAVMDAALDILPLYEKYDAELRVLARKLRPIYHAIQRRGYGATFGDVEGELMYMLIREGRPDLVFEISPDCGWSTNYILAALTANHSGVLHSFELERIKHGQPTEKLIRGNQHPDWDQSRLLLHLGDARDLAPRVAGDINCLLLDSCHEDWFAQWYVDQVFPRVQGPVMVQDIAFADGLENSSEASWLWDWFQRQGLGVRLVGALEREVESRGRRAAYAERRHLRCNSVVFFLPRVGSEKLPSFSTSPEDLLEQAEIAAGSAADELVTQAVREILTDVSQVNRHRLLIRAGLIFERLGEPEEAARQCQRALGVVLQGDKQQRDKGLMELFRLFLQTRHWRPAWQTAWLLAAFHPQGLWSAIAVLPRALVRRGKDRS